MRSFNDGADGDRRWLYGSETRAARARTFSAEMGLQSFVLMAPAEGAVIGFERVTGSAREAFEPPAATGRAEPRSGEGRTGGPWLGRTGGGRKASATPRLSRSEAAMVWTQAPAPAAPRPGDGARDGRPPRLPADVLARLREQGLRSMPDRQRAVGRGGLAIGAVVVLGRVPAADACERVLCGPPRLAPRIGIPPEVDAPAAMSVTRVRLARGGACSRWPGAGNR